MTADNQEPKWYCIGRAMLCANENDAKKCAKENARDWPNNAPYRAVQLVEVMQALVQGEPAVPKAWLWQFSDGDWHEVPFATKDGCEHECAGYSGKAHPLFLPTPPAQTPCYQDSEMLIGVFSAIAKAGFTIVKTHRGYTLETLGKVTGQSAAQTPPRLTDEQIASAWAVAEGEHNASSAVKRKITRAIETAVLKQAGWPE